VGELRWAAPRPCPPWKGVRQAQAFGPSAIQPDTKVSSIAEFKVDGPQSEDCLHLNIWTPGTDSTRRPVMVWLHGGYLSMGSGSQAAFRGNLLAKVGNVVVVTLNYRLGALGFLNLKEITGGQIPATGNEGILDQIAALKWVKNNIAAFGGDPGNVTVFGESAGGTCIQILMGLPQAAGLFHKTIIQSAVKAEVRPLEKAVQISREFLRLSGVKDKDGLLALPADTVLAAQRKLSGGSPSAGPATIPVLDGAVITRLPLEAIEKGASPGIPTLAGTNAEEWKLFNATSPKMAAMDEAALEARCRGIFPPEEIKGVIQNYRENLAKQGKPATPMDIFTAIQTDLVFRNPLERFLEARCRHEKEVYSYLFTWKSPRMGGILEACHGLEIGFIFGTYEPGFGGSGPEAERLAHKMQEAWTAFARTGNPSCESLGQWPRYCDKQEVMRLY
jgi:para-nitrobenzyl esterase